MSSSFAAPNSRLIAYDDRSLLFASVNRISAVKSSVIVCQNPALASRLSDFSADPVLRSSVHSVFSVCSALKRPSFGIGPSLTAISFPRRFPRTGHHQLSPFFSYACGLFDPLQKLNRFLFNGIWTLFGKIGGWVPLNIQPSPSDFDSDVLGFHHLTKPSFRNSRLFTSIQNPRGCTPPFHFLFSIFPFPLERSYVRCPAH